MSFDIVRGDTLPAMPVDIATDVSDADSVVMRWAKPDGTTYETNLTAVDAEEGTFMMEWGDGDTDTVGPHIGEVVVTTDGNVQTFPSDGKIYWWVGPTVADLVGG